MAIIIPSKNIYEQKHKLPKTYIDKVEYKNTNLKSGVVYDDIIWAEEHTQFENSTKESVDGSYYSSTSNNSFYAVYAYTKSYVLKTEIEIPIIQDNGLSEILFLDQSKIKYSIIYDRTVSDLSSKAVISVDTQNTSKWTTTYDKTAEVYSPVEGGYTPNQTSEKAFSLKNTASFGVPEVAGNTDGKIEAKADIDIQEQITVAVVETDNSKKYKISVILPVGYEKKTLGGHLTTPAYTNVNIPLGNYGVGLTHTYEHIFPKQVKFSFYGNKDENNKIEIPLTYGQGGNVFATETNELLQSESKTFSRHEKIKGYADFVRKTNGTDGAGKRIIEYKYYVGKEENTTLLFCNVRYDYPLVKPTSGGGQITMPYIDAYGYLQLKASLNSGIEYDDIPKTLYVDFGLGKGTATVQETKAKSIVEAYENGKETAELLCSIGEYKDENGNLAISTKDKTKPMHFTIGDIVIPQKYTAKGDKPVSLNSDATTKKFVVVGTDFVFDGAVWQKIILQEI